MMNFSEYFVAYFMTDEKHSLFRDTLLKEPLSFNCVSEDVFVAQGEIVQLNNRAVGFIKEQAFNSPRGRSRICAHRDSSDSLHEMVIAITPTSYIRPHRHRHKSESFHLIEGEADVVIFSDEGDVTDVIRLSNKENFYYRLNEDKYHTLLINSSVLVIHEVTNGPFDTQSSEYAPFSPEEGSDDVAAYIARLRRITK